MVIVCEYRTGCHCSRAVVNASPGEARQASSIARFTTMAAITSRSMVVLPVPGGPLTANTPQVSLSVRRIWFTANCWLKASGRLVSVTHRPEGIRSGAQPARTHSDSFCTSVRVVPGLVARYWLSALPAFPRSSAPLMSAKSLAT